MLKCPICGTESEHKGVKLGLELVEEDYECDVCGYYMFMYDRAGAHGIDFDRGKMDWLAVCKAAWESRENKEVKHE